MESSARRKKRKGNSRWSKFWMIMDDETEKILDEREMKMIEMRKRRRHRWEIKRL